MSSAQRLLMGVYAEMGKCINVNMLHRFLNENSCHFKYQHLKTQNLFTSPKPVSTLPFFYNIIGYPVTKSHNI